MCEAPTWTTYVDTLRIYCEPIFMSCLCLMSQISIHVFKFFALTSLNKINRICPQYENNNNTLYLRIPEEIFDKSFQVSISIDGVLSDHTTTNLVPESEATNKWVLQTLYNKLSRNRYLLIGSQVGRTFASIREVIISYPNASLPLHHVITR